VYIKSTANNLYCLKYVITDYLHYRLGFAQLVIGILTICLGIFDVSSSAVAFDVFSVGRSVTGIWVGTVVRKHVCSSYICQQLTSVKCIQRGGVLLWDSVATGKMN